MFPHGHPPVRPSFSELIAIVNASAGEAFDFKLGYIVQLEMGCNALHFALTTQQPIAPSKLCHSQSGLSILCENASPVGKDLSREFCS